MIIKGKTKYVIAVNVDNRRENITDGSISDHLTTGVIHVHNMREMARSINQLLTERIKITAFWDIIPHEVACKMQ
jgi:hypothetical protein